MTLRFEGWQEMVHAKMRLPTCTTWLPLGKLGYGSQPLWGVRLLQVDCCVDGKYKLTVLGAE